ncbi:KTSC domain containing protein [uncultured Caudovirales phage]|uniref:KTSC domain containing protein n=1 Tax=uncultured Caudovirales phage TaxID=2100421 RepID=A0A6J5KRP5_9CAUD|nr:KTSC domain containing protein [uncultured Caudovirales phage]
MARQGNLPPSVVNKAVAYGLKPSIVAEVAAFQQQGGVTESPLAMLPAPSPRGMAARSGAFVEGVGLIHDLVGEVSGTSKYDINTQNFGYDITSGTYYEGMHVNGTNPLTPRYTNLADQYGANVQDRMDAPAAMSVLPTSTSNLQRPRTVAAGWEPYPGETKVGKLSVVFRDGTYYNYYDVTDTEWERFKAAPSKGPMLNPNPVPGFLMYKNRGEATLDFMSQQAQELQYRTASASQQLYRTETEARQGIRPLSPGRPKKAAGVNPTKGGKNTATANRQRRTK